MKRKRKDGRAKERRLFFLFWILGWLFVSQLVIFGTAGFLSAEALSQFKDASIWGAAFMIFAALQSHLLRRYLRIDLRRWLLWSFVGIVVGQICHELFTAVVTSPNSLWWYARIDPPLQAMDSFLFTIYHGLRLFFRFSLLALFQSFALPGSLRGRHLWLLAATLSGPLCLVTGALLPAIIQAIALERMTALTGQGKNSREKITREHEEGCGNEDSIPRLYASSAGTQNAHISSVEQAASSNSPVIPLRL